MSLLAAVAACGASAVLLGSVALPADAVDGARAGRDKAPPGMQQPGERRNENAADVGFYDGFEDYGCPSILVPQGGWEGWDESQTACDEARVACFPDPVHSGEHSLAIKGNPNLSLAEDIIHQFTGFEGETAWRLSAWVFIPDTAHGPSYFILLNDYEHGQGQDNNWSTQLKLWIDEGIIESDAGTPDDMDGPTLPLIKDQWAQISVLIDLVNDRQTITYNDELLDEKSWTGGVSGGGVLVLDTLDLWADAGPDWIYYDDIEIEAVPLIGAGCMRDGSCVEGLSQDDCQWPDCFFQGFGSRCEFQDCLVEGENGWIVDELPFQFRSDTCLEENSCDLSDEGDVQFEVTIPHAGRYLFNACDAGTDPWDNVLWLGTVPCGDDVAENDDSNVCDGLQVRLAVDLEAGTYYVTLGSYMGSCGEFGLHIREICVQEVERPEGARDEAEACGEDTNGGCNMEPPAFEATSCGDIIWGSFWYLPGDPPTRDTDWYALHVDEPKRVTMTADAEAGFIVGLIEDSDTQDCEVVQYVAPNDNVLPCEGKTAEVSFDLEPGDYWLFAGSNADDLTFCGDGLDNYWLQISCCVAAPDGDVNFDECTDFDDLLVILGKWESAGPGGDGNCDGFVDFDDLLLVLGGWSAEGECP